MKQRIKYAVIFIILLFTEFLIARYGKGAIRGYIGDVLVIPTVYYLIRIIFAKDSIFSVYVLPFICYSMGWIAEVLQANNIADKLGLSPDSPLGIIFGSVFDLRDGVAYLFGFYLIGIFLAIESRTKEDRQFWYPICVFIHWTWGNLQTMAGFFLYLWYIKCPHTYYRGVVRTAWPLDSGLSMGMFIFTPKEPDIQDESDEAQNKRSYCEQVAVHEYGHTFQAILLGPFYPIIIGIPSLSWKNIKYFQQLREEKQLKYTWLFCERWASVWGEKITKEKSIWN